VAEAALMKQMRLHKCEYGTAVLMEVATGEIKAIANISQNPNDPEDFGEYENIAVGKASEPGSTFKLLSAMALLEEGVSPTDSFNTSGGVKMFCGNVPIHDSHDGGYGTISLQRAFEVSSNVAFSGMVSKYFGKGTKLGPEAFIRHIYGTGIHQPLGLAIPGEAKPLIKNTSNRSWSCPTLPEMSIGYEIMLTPLQTLSIYNAVANGGVMVKPQFIKRIVQKGQVVKEFKPEVLNPRICGAKTIEGLRRMMEGVVQSKGGTASNLKGLNYTLAGKTGTAVVADNNRGYKSENGKIYRASFVGYFPAESPQYSCIVLINRPTSGTYYGNVIAWPVFKEIADKVYSTSLDLHKDLVKDSLFAQSGLPFMKATFSDEAEIITQKTLIPFSNQYKGEVVLETISTQNEIKMKARKMIEDLVPDVREMGMKDAFYLLENLGLKVEAKGMGKVREQSMPAGMRFTKGQKIILNFS
jgi:cell division protein FtsI (penicillin-binding protein 3)